MSWECKKQNIHLSLNLNILQCHLHVLRLWLSNLLVEVGFFQSDSILYVDNTSSTQIATNLMFHKCTKHIQNRLSLYKRSLS